MSSILSDMVDGDVISPPEDEFDVTATGIRAKRYTTTKVVNCKKRWRGRNKAPIIPISSRGLVVVVVVVAYAQGVSKTSYLSNLH